MVETSADAARFSRWGDDASEELNEIFLDRDPDAFRVLLSCMRHKRALLPEDDRDLFKRVILDSQFLGIEWLETEVKAKVFEHASFNDREAIFELYNK